MSRLFSIQTVLRQTPNELLRRFFAKLGHELKVDWDRLKKRDVGLVLTEIEELPKRQYDAVEAVLHNVFKLACEGGIGALLEAGPRCGAHNLVAQLPHDACAYAKAMQVWLEHPDVFDDALVLYQVDQLHWWRKRGDLPRAEPDTSEEARRTLGRSIAALLLREQGRGRNCTIDHIRRGDADYFLAYPDDYVHNVPAHDEEGVLGPGCFRHTFLVVFAYNRSEGALELYAKMGGKLKSKLEMLFAQAVLDHVLGPWDRKPQYHLGHLLDPSFDFATDPEDGVTVRIKRIRVTPKNGKRSLVLEADEGGPPDDVHYMIDNYLNKHRLPLSVLDVTLVTLRFEFDAGEDGKVRTMTFDIVYPNSSGLRNLPPGRAELAEKYLKRWGIDVTGSGTADLAADGL